jgi:serine/threonine-protein kinase
MVIADITAESLSGISLDTLPFDIAALSVEEDVDRQLLLHENYNETQPRISPDGRWMAYTSNESGESQIYVRPFPDVEEGRWQISTDGGDSPLWSPDGRELFYRSGDAVMAVSVETETAFSFDTPAALFQGEYVGASFDLITFELNPWDISPDGKRFLMMKGPQLSITETTSQRRINIILNWFEELKERVPTD